MGSTAKDYPGLLWNLFPGQGRPAYNETSQEPIHIDWKDAPASAAKTKLSTTYHIQTEIVRESMLASIGDERTVIKRIDRLQELM